MKFIKILGVVIAIILIIITLLPSRAHVERSALINAEPSTVFSQVNTPANWKKWDAWANIDPIMKSSFEGEKGVGAVHKWESSHPDVGSGTQTIIKSVAHAAIEMKLDFEDERGGKARWTFLDKDGKTEVVWRFDTELPWSQKIFGLFIDQKLGPMFEQGLANLKEICEKMAEKAEVPVQEITFDNDQWVLTIVDSANITGMEDKHKEIFTEIGDFMKEQGISEAGKPLAILRSYSLLTVKIEAGIPTTDSIETSGRINCIKLKAGKAITTQHFGKYETIPATYQLLKDWVSTNNIEPAGQAWQVYTTDPRETEDISKWETQIYLPIN